MADVSVAPSSSCMEVSWHMTSGADEVEALARLDAALARLDAALELWLEVELEQGHAIPEPLPAARDYSGKFTIRTSPLVHRLAADAAEGMGVSLNEFASEALAIAAGAAAPLRRVRAPR